MLKIKLDVRCLMWMTLLFCNLQSVWCEGERLTRSHRFGYARSRQKTWHENHEQCAGEYQSPIKIIGHRAIPLSLRAVEMVGYHDPLPGPLYLINNGHSVKLKPAHLDQVLDPPAVYGALLTDHYIMDSFHFHWGLRNYRGSEHRVNGIRYPMEMHVIHRKKSYGSISEALGYNDGLAVLAFFFQDVFLYDFLLWTDLELSLTRNQEESASILGLDFPLLAPFHLGYLLMEPFAMLVAHCSNIPEETFRWECRKWILRLREKDNTKLEPLVKHLSDVRQAGQTVYLDTTFTMSSLLPRDLDIYYTYRGSLTTPPCNEAVTWIVFPEPQYISIRQLKKFRKLSSGNSKLADNYRILQELGNRLVFVRRMYSQKPATKNLTEDQQFWYSDVARRR